MSSADCSLFVPQRFRPAFCKTCSRLKSEHEGAGGYPNTPGSLSERPKKPAQVPPQRPNRAFPPPPLVGKPPSPIAPHPHIGTPTTPPPTVPLPLLSQKPPTPLLAPSAPAPLPPNMVSPPPRNMGPSIGIMRPPPKTVGPPPPNTVGPPPTPNTMGPPPRARTNSSNATSKPPPNRTKSNKGFGRIGNGRASVKGVKKPLVARKSTNANDYFVEILKGVLSDGIGLTPSETEEILKRVKATETVKSAEEHKRVALVLNNSRTRYLERLVSNSNRFLDNQKELKQIVTVQSLVRGHLSRKRYGSESPEALAMMKKRNAAYIELVKTEKAFLRNMDGLVKNFVVKLRHSDVVAPHESAFIFSNVEVLIEAHRNLCERLQKAGENWPFVHSIGSIFLDIKDLLNAASVFVSNFKNAMNEVERLSIENQRFVSFLDEQAAHDDVDLTTKLTMPVNRIAQYEYYLHTIMDHTPKDSEDREACENAFAVLAQSSLVVQTSLVKSGETAEIMRIQRKLKGDGPMTLVKDGRLFLSELRFKKFLVVLFSDLVVLAKIPPGKSKGFTKREKKGGEREEPHKVKKTSPLKDSSLTFSGKTISLKLGEDVFTLTPDPSVNEKDLRHFSTSFQNALEDLDRAKVFGVPILDTINREMPEDGIPLVLKAPITHIRENYLTSPGIFRLAGSKTDTMKLKEVYDRGGEEATNLQLRGINVNDLCDVVKSYLRSFPEPLLTFEIYDPLIDLMKKNRQVEERLPLIKQKLQECVSEKVLKVLRYIIQFLQGVASNSEVNKMTPSNLSIVFGPTFLWSKECSLESAMDMPFINGVVQLIIEHPAETLPPEQ